MVLGSYYLTMVKPGDKGEGKIFRDEDEALMAYQPGDRHPAGARSRSAAPWSSTARKSSAIVDTTVGRHHLQPAPSLRIWAMWTVPIPRTMFDYEIDFQVDQEEAGRHHRAAA